MIPKASQRSGGQDLATHLLNALDNEYVEVAEVSGAVASDLHGAFAEWEAIASGLTKCRKYLYSLSVNPDLGQGELTRAQYLDYVDRVEKKLGLEGQPRAVVFHIKEGREHCHVVWSRIDYQSEKAIHLAFDRDKLMMVTREFARDHGLTLPDGYGRDPLDDRGRRPESLYEKQQQRATGLSKDERMQMVTHAWKSADSPRAFVRALEEMGYVLAAGKRPYVLVDLYGTMNALPKLIDDRQVKTKDIRAFLEKEFPPEQLPTVDEAKALVGQHRKAREEFAKAQDNGRKRDTLLSAQAKRREGVAAEHSRLLEGQRLERAALAAEQLSERQALRAGYLAEARRIKAEREAAKPTGLAAFLGRVTGITLIREKVQRYRDRQRLEAFVARKTELVQAQQGAAHMQRERHRLQAVDGERNLKALAAVEKRELQSLEVKRVREQRIKDRAGHEHMPALTLELKPKGRRASVRKAQNRYKDSLRVPEERQARVEETEQSRPIDLQQSLQDALAAQSPLSKAVDVRDAFTRAADEGKSGDGQGSGEDGAIAEKPVSRASRSSERKRGRDDDFGRER
ncbi:relaxase/mobilization nuclease domain-containing protein [Sinorhizobium meliloti]|uniref:relaxase/mobilization nuclease domain-containing protein n=1 Tax=Rhizobium meliloti TaxID=382 RepID=UPI0002FE5922|nr:relaxase/mobilization nuclease domain-containing protein [Sinorhizobium meliloti]MDE3767572.1 relaxase/mobilization nuclease domain-containing protein [Sinorhizobium meliloti]MDE3779798.1 relaxase/mobilization nuclease domain-containing protein [Sinorhizobium meliloti]MDE3807423.1 relaxase/mobilization nuclease domain-containing protein [Sinorhizobium meliloti]